MVFNGCLIVFSPNVLQRTKSKTDQDDWFAALRDAKNNNPQCFVGQKPSHDRMSAVESRFTNHGNGIVRENYRLRGQCGKPTKESFDGVFYEVSKRARRIFTRVSVSLDRHLFHETCFFNDLYPSEYNNFKNIRKARIRIFKFAVICTWCK